MSPVQFSLKRLLAWSTVATAAVGIARWQHWPLPAMAALVAMVGAAEIDRLRGRTGPATLVTTGAVLVYWWQFGPPP